MISKLAVLEAIEQEEEFEGEMPDELFRAASASKEALTKAIRFACRRTKDNITNRVLALSESKNKDSRGRYDLSWVEFDDI
jgi:predicted secreted Zn-dependent protease